MTRTLEIPEVLDAQIQAAARAQNTDAGAWLIEAARRALEAEPRETDETKRRALIRSLRGRAKGRGPTVDEFLSERQAEARVEAGL